MKLHGVCFLVERYLDNLKGNIFFNKSFYNNIILSFTV